MERVPTEPGTLATGETVATGSASVETDATLTSGGAGAPPRAPEDLPIVDASVYQQLDEVGRGGLGRILRAKDLRTGRIVAIKEMRVDSPDAAARFVREALVTANLQHPAIVPVYEVGRWRSGQPFYAMKLVTGKPLSDVVKAATGPDERIALLPHLIAVADALAYAHGERVIHRDLKPANVMVGGHGETVVIDWGLARRLGDDDQASLPPLRDTAPGETVIGAVLGTPQYMAPEQARGERVDERADVYAIGALLYHVLAGEPPFEGIGTVAGVLEAVRSRGPAPLAQVAPWVPRDLIAIVDHAMARDLDARYSTATALAEDLRRFATGQLVTAHTYSRAERIRRFVRRYRTLLAITSLALVTVAVVGAVSVVRVLDERASARTAEVREREARAEAERMLAATYATRAKDELARQQPARAAPYLVESARLGRDASDLHALASIVWAQLPQIEDPGLHRITGLRFVPGGDAVIATPDEVTRRSLPTGTVRWRAPLEGTSELHVVGDVVIATTRTGASLLALADGAPVATLGALPRANGAWNVSAIITDDRWLALKAPTGEVEVWDLRDRTLRGRLSTKLVSGYAAASPDGTRVVVTGHDRVPVRSALYDVTSGREIVELCSVEEPCGVVPPAVGADVFGVVRDLTAHGGVALVFDWDGKQKQRISLASQIQALELDPDSRTIVAVTTIGHVFAFNLDTGVLRWSRQPLLAGYGLQLDRAHRQLWAFGRDGGAALLDIGTGTVRGWWSMLTQVADLQVSANGDVAAIIDDTASLRWWRTGGGSTAMIAPAVGRVWRVGWLADGRLVSGSNDGTVAIHDPDSGAVVAAWKGHSERVTEVIPLNDGRVLTASRDRRIVIWDPATMTPSIELADVGHRAALAPTATRVASADETGRVAIHELTGTRASRELGRLPGPVIALRWSPDGKWVAAIEEGGEIMVWQAETGALAHRKAGLPPPRNGGFDLMFSPDSRWLASARHGSSFVIDLVDHREVPLHDAPDQQVYGLAFSADSTMLATTQTDGSTLIWTPATGEQRLKFEAPAQALSIGFSPDQKLFITGANDRGVRLWDLETGAELTSIVAPDEVFTLRWSPDGKHVAFTTLAQAIVWRLPTGEAVPRGSLERLARCRSGQRVGENGSLVAAPAPADCATH